VNDSLSTNIRKWLFPNQYEDKGRPSPHRGTINQTEHGHRSVINSRYRILEPLGSGGMAGVHLAYDEVLGRDVALKVLGYHLADDEEFVERFRREARIAAALSHPNIASIHDLGETGDGTYYIVMEYVPGGTLKDRIRKGPLPPSTAIAIALQVARALEAAHVKGTIHRDVKPQNILLTEAGVVKVVDFGIARAAAFSKLTRTGHVLGTTSYMSPEQAGGKPASPRSDLYSLGVVLYEMLTGKLPYRPDTAGLIAARPTRGPLRPPKQVNPAVPAKLSDAVVRLLAQDPKQRYPDAPSLIADLEGARGERPEGATTQLLSTVLRAWTAYKDRTHNKTKPYFPPAPPARPEKPAEKSLSELIMESIGRIAPRSRPLLGPERRGLRRRFPLFDRLSKGSSYKPAKQKPPQKGLPRVVLTVLILAAVLAVPSLCSQAPGSGTKGIQANEPDGGSVDIYTPPPGTVAPAAPGSYQVPEIPSGSFSDPGSSALPNSYDFSYPSYQEPRKEVENQVEVALERMASQ
jgi:serine/threonine protein kinase